jgi:hypothetical protein
MRGENMLWGLGLMLMAAGVVWGYRRRGTRVSSAPSLREATSRVFTPPRDAAVPPAPGWVDDEEADTKMYRHRDLFPNAQAGELLTGSLPRTGSNE